MPHKKAASKWLRKTKKRTVANQKVKDGIEYLARQLKKALDAKDKAKAIELVKQLAKAVDKASEKNILKKNKAARIKSRNMKKVNAVK